MAAALSNYEARTRQAVAWYWRALNQPAQRLEGFQSLVSQLLVDNGLPEARVHSHHKLELPGFFTPTRKWDLVVMHEGRLVAALGIKARTAHSLEHDFVALGEETLSAGQEMDALYRRGAFGSFPRPRFGWLVLLEDDAATRQPAAVPKSHLPPLPEYRNSSPAERYELLLRKLERNRLFDACALLLSTEEQMKTGHYREPARDLGIQPFLIQLANAAELFAEYR